MRVNIFLSFILSKSFHYQLLWQNITVKRIDGTVCCRLAADPPTVSRCLVPPAGRQLSDRSGLRSAAVPDVGVCERPPTCGIALRQLLTQHALCNS